MPLDRWPRFPQKYFLLIVFVVLTTQLQVLSADPPSDGDIDTQAARLAKDYRISVVVAQPTFPVKTLHGEIAGREAKPNHLKSYVPILASEWSLYPPELIQRTGLRRIILCQSLSFAGQLRTAIPDFENSDLYLDVERGRYAERYVRLVIHHEFYHLIDYRDDGSLYADEKWVALNPVGFKYGRGGKNAQSDATVSLLNNDQPGFLNRYATTGVEEDKAEIFAHLIVNPQKLDERTKSDAIVADKARRMKELLQKFCPQVDGRFWESAAKRERPNG